MGKAVMGLDEARRILKGKHGSIDRLGPAYVEHAYAAATLMDHYQANRHELRPVTVRDVGLVDDVYWRANARELTERTVGETEGAGMMESGWFKWADAAAVGTPAGQASPGGATPGAVASGRAGAKLVQRLPGPVSSYFIQALGDGTAGLYLSGEIDDAGDTMQTAIGDRQVRARYEYEAAKSKAQLQNMNAKNRAFWQKHERRA
jgi:hypothetical protein